MGRDSLTSWERIEPPVPAAGGPYSTYHLFVGPNRYDASGNLMVDQIADGQQHWYGIGLLWRLGYFSSPAATYCPAADNLIGNDANNWKHPKYAPRWVEAPDNGRDRYWNINIRTNYYDRQFQYQRDRETEGTPFPASRMRTLRKSDISCPGVYPGNGKLTDVGYLYCEPWTSRDPAHTSSSHVRATPVLMRSGRVVVFPMHPGYATYSGNNPEYNGFLPNADVFAATGTVQPPINTFGRY